MRITERIGRELVEYDEMIQEQKERTRQELAGALRAYYIWHSDAAKVGDLESWVEQGLDAADAVLLEYPLAVGRLAPGS